MPKAKLDVAPSKVRGSASWELEASRIIKAEMQRRGVTYFELSRRLAEIGEPESPKGIGMKVNRGTFAFAWALRVFRVLGVTRPDVAALDE